MEVKLNKNNKQHIKRAKQKLSENITEWLKLDLKCFNLQTERDRKIKKSCMIFSVFYRRVCLSEL